MNEPRSAPAPRVRVAPLVTRLPVKSCVVRVPPIVARPMLVAHGAPVAKTSVWPSVTTEMFTTEVVDLVSLMVYETPAPVSPQAAQPSPLVIPTHLRAYTSGSP